MILASYQALWKRIMHRKRARFVCRCPNVVGSPRTAQELLVKGRGRIWLGRNVVFGCADSPEFLSTYGYVEARYDESSVSIGDDCVFNNGVSIISAGTDSACSGITIGSRCLFGTRVQIMDSDFHGLRVNERTLLSAVRCRPVLVGNDCWIGSSAILLKGVVLGDGCVVGAGSVVTGEFPAGSLIAGNPARLVRIIQ